MPEIITYSLRNGASSSDKYYSDIAVFTQELMNRTDNETFGIILDLRSYIKLKQIEEVRSFEEYFIEFMTIGVLWREYMSRALKLSFGQQKLRSALASLRQKSEHLKSRVDVVRGELISKYMVSKGDENASRKECNLRNFNLLIKWLQASGDFRQEVKRLVNWRVFLGGRGEGYTSKMLAAAISLAEWFAVRARSVLGCYTSGVNGFLKNEVLIHNKKEDLIFCGRREEEYHLNMVGAEIMNNVFQRDFIKTKRKMLLLPACMRAMGGRECKAKQTPKGFRCAECTKECRVSFLNKMGKDHNFEVYMIPHESEAISGGKTQYGEVGIIGVACVLNLLSGGWKAVDLNFVPQCVILDYCGCRNHWHPQGITTDINVSKLKKVLQIN